MFGKLDVATVRIDRIVCHGHAMDKKEGECGRSTRFQHIEYCSLWCQSPILPRILIMLKQNVGLIFLFFGQDPTRSPAVASELIDGS